MAQDLSGWSEHGKYFDKVWDINWSRNPFDLKNFTSAPRKVSEIVAAERYDIVHVHTPVAAFISRLALKKLRYLDPHPKIIYTAHGFHFHKQSNALRNAFFIFLEKMAGRWTDFIIVINKEDFESALRYKIVPEDRLVYMPGIGIDLTNYDPEQVSTVDINKFRSEIGLKEEHKLFLMIAEFNKGKRHLDLLHALKILQRQDVHIAFAGVGPTMDEVKNEATKLGIANQLHFLGFRNDIEVLIRSSIATILPSEREGLPRSVMESLSLCIPVIGTDIRGIRDLLANGAGFLVKIGETKALAQWMDWAITHSEEMLQMGSLGRRQMQAFQIENIIRMHEQLYFLALEDKHKKE